MSFKNKEDRNKYMRDYRGKQAEEKKAGLELQDNLKHFLVDRCGFESMPFSEFIEMAQACTISGDDILLDGKQVDPFDVLTGSNLLLAVTTVKV